MNRTRIITAAALTLTAAGLLFAGPLNPPAGPITSTNKTLQEVEPRIAINTTNTPGDADSLFKITQRGSYYLTGNITGVVGKHGVEIAVGADGSSISIDLMGFELAGVFGSLDGISVAGASITRNVAIRNGTVRAWGGDGIDMLSGLNNLLSDLRIEGNGGRGILAGSVSTVTGCTALSNSDDGIYAGDGSTITGCTAFSNTGTGISTQFGSTITGCSAFGNRGDGISTTTGSTITGCSAYANTGGGITANNGCTISNCTARSNTLDGIVVNNDCLVLANMCSLNGFGAGLGAGVRIVGSDNRIEGNNCTDADRGINVELAGNIIIRNTCSGNTLDWVIAANNVVGPIVDRRAPASAAISGFSAPDSTGSTHPNANFSY